MIVFIGILFIVWPIIPFTVFVWIALKKKWWSNDKLSIICGGIGILGGVYYMVLFNGGFSNLEKGWPIWLICFTIIGWSSWYMMRNSLILMEQRQLEKEQKEQKKIQRDQIQKNGSPMRKDSEFDNAQKTQAKE